MAQKRRKRGTGTIQRQGDGSWIARTTGNERSGRFPVGPEGYREAERALDLWNKQIGRGANPNEGRQPTRDVLAAWLVEIVKPHKTPRTFEFYKRHVGYATTYIGDIPIEGLSSRAIDKMLGQLRADGLSPRSVDHVRSVLHNALNVIHKRWKIIDSNPADDIPSFRVRKTGDRALSAVQAAILLAAVEGHRLCALYHVALTLGLRKGELLGLRWSDVDWTAATLTIRQQVTVDEAGKLIIEPTTKTDEAPPVLPLPPDCLARLRQRQAEDKADARIFQQRAADKATKQGKPIPLIHWNPNDLIFPSDEGTVLMPRNFTRHMKAVVVRANKATHARATAEGWESDVLRAALLPSDLHPHDLRHTALTDLAAHAEAKAVQSIARHADIDTTMRLYAGRHAGAMRAAVEAVEKQRRMG